MTNPRRFLPLLFAIAAAGCGEAARENPRSGHEGEAPAAASPEAAADGPACVRIAPEMLRDLRITTARAESRAGGEGVTALGELQVNEDAYAEVGSLLTARVGRVLASPGESVKEGQPLLELESVEVGKARSDYLAARARIVLARKSLERKRSLSGEQIAPARELQEAEAEAMSSEATARAARTTLLAMGLSEAEVDGIGDGSGKEAESLLLRAPIAGTVLERNAVRGQLADPQRTLFRIADLSRLWLTVHAFERDAVRVKVKTSARVSFPALPGRPFSGSVTLIGQQVDVSSRTILVRIEMANADGALRPGMSATAWLPIGDPGAVVTAVPAASLQRLAAGWCVFIPRDDKAFEIRSVGRGRDLGGDVEVLSGLQPQETVVVDGAFLLKAEADKARGGGGHDE
jgi:cobalt-zinc-cadmium efflux system membrane fusion protein